MHKVPTPGRDIFIRSQTTYLDRDSSCGREPAECDPTSPGTHDPPLSRATVCPAIEYSNSVL